MPFYASGAVAFLILCIMMVWSPEGFLMHYFNPHLLAMTHMAALGWGTMIVFGASYQLMPVITEKKLWNEDVALASWYGLLAGVLLLVYTFWTFRTGWIMILGGSLIVVSSILYLFNALFTGTVRKQGHIPQYFMVSSAVWLVFTVTVGLLLAINLKFPFFDRNHMEILKLHAHLGLAGWFLQLITGVSSKLIPMFLLGRSDKNKLLTYAWWFQNAGLLLFIADVYMWGYSDRILLYMVLAAVGIGCWFYFLIDSFRHRIKRKIDFQMRHTVVSMWCLIGAVLLIPLIHHEKGSVLATVYGTLLFMGWITGIILGKSFKTLPFIVWNTHYKELTGQVEVPLPRDLYREGWVRWQWWLYLGSVIGLVLGILSRQLIVVQLATWAWLGLAVLYILNIAQIIFHRKMI